MYQARILNLASAVSSCRLCDSPLPPGANLLPWHCNRGLRPAALPRPHSCSLPSHVLGALAKWSCKPTATNTAGQSYDRRAPQKTTPLWLFQSHVGPFYLWINWTGDSWGCLRRHDFQPSGILFSSPGGGQHASLPRTKRHSTHCLDYQTKGSE